MRVIGNVRTPDDHDDDISEFDNNDSDKNLLSVILNSPQHFSPGVVGAAVVVGGVGPGDGVGPPPAPDLVAIHQRVLDLVLPSS